MAAILDLLVKMNSQRQINVRFEILVVESVENMYLHKIIGALVQNLIFQNGFSGHLGFGPLEKNAGIFGRDMEANYFIESPKKSNQSSNLTSQRMVTELRCLTLL